MNVAALVLAAGQSRRMGRPKPLLPIGPRRVIEWVVQALIEAGIRDIVVVTGHRREEVEAALVGYPVRCVYNPNYAEGEMLSSIQAGLRALSDDCMAMLVVLGDQPALQASVVRALLGVLARHPDRIVIPTHEGRRGHPVAVPRAFWAEILALSWKASLRDVLRRHADAVMTVAVDAPAIVRDMDTPADYEREQMLLLSTPHIPPREDNG